MGVGDDDLLIHRTLPALAAHPDELAARGEAAELRWFNQIHAHHRTFYQVWCRPRASPPPLPSLLQPPVAPLGA